jgi:hypothetical protein
VNIALYNRFAKIFGAPRKHRSFGGYMPSSKNLDVSLSPNRPLGAGGEPDDDDDDDKRKQKEQAAMKIFAAELADVAKRDGGVQAICKHVLSGSSNLSEFELTECLTAAAQKAYPGLRPDQAFAKAYTAPAGELMRRAVQATKEAQFVSKVAVGRPLSGGGATLTAYDELMAKADELRKRDPSLRQDQAFTKVYTDPANREIAGRERRENRPIAS